MRFETTDINLASFLTASGFQPSIYRQLSANLAVFEFADSALLHEAIVAYESGKCIPAKALLSTRTWLYHQASNVCREGRP